MKPISFLMKGLVILAFLSTNTNSATAQNDIRTDSFKVMGNCGMCKERIENAAYIRGVKRADWNKNSGTLVVTYKPSKTTFEAIHKSIAKAGHATDKVEATEADYKRLPDCCQYKTNTCSH